MSSSNTDKFIELNQDMPRVGVVGDDGNDDGNDGYMFNVSLEHSGVMKRPSIETRTCIICLVKSNEDINDESIVLNTVCCECRYYVHDSCFSEWYETRNKCIICRKHMDVGDNAIDLETDEDVNPLGIYPNIVSFGAGNIIREMDRNRFNFGFGHGGHDMDNGVIFQMGMNAYVITQCLNTCRNVLHVFILMVVTWIIVSWWFSVVSEVVA